MYLTVYKLIFPKSYIPTVLLIFALATASAQRSIPELEAIERLLQTPKPSSFGQYGFDTPAPHPFLLSPSDFYHLNNLSVQRQNQQIMDEVDAYIARSMAQKARAQSLIDEAVREMNEHEIQYTLSGRMAPGRALFYTSLRQLEEMLQGRQPLSLKKAVFLSEFAYDPTLSWPDFRQSIEAMATHLGFYMQTQGYDPDDNSAKNLAIYNFFTDTLKVKHKDREQPVTTYPMFYDFEDFWGREDRSKMFVTKLIREGTGQCHSLPLLYLILAEEMNAGAHLAFAPNHSYIKIRDKRGDWHNIELTTHSLTSDQYIMQTGFVTSSAIANKIYMNPLTKKEVVAQCVNDLMMNYIRKFGNEDFILEGTNLAIKHNQNNLTAHLINHHYYQELLQHILKQYQDKGLTDKALLQDEKAQYVYRQMMGSRALIDNLGYADMPADLYENWLRSVEDEGQKQEHRNKMRTLMGQIGN